MIKRRVFSLALLWVMCLSLIGVSAQTATPAQTPTVAPIDERVALLEDERNTIEIINAFGPSVVAINVTVAGQRLSMDELLDQLPPQLRGFENLLPPGTLRQFQQQQSRPQRGTGSGFVIDDDGRIITNYHVIRSALQTDTVELRQGATIRVVFPSSSEEYDVRVLGANPDYDLALLEMINADNLPEVVRQTPPLIIAESDEVQVGQKTIAIGNPFGFQSTVTSGIVSAVGREIEGSGLQIPLIQTDAAINRGNSGGPLLNSRGELIGINTAIISPTGGSVGIGFAVPSSFLLESLAGLGEGGLIGFSIAAEGIEQRPRIGISSNARMQNYPPEIRARMNLPAQGIVVTQVAPNSPAAEAGLRPAEMGIVMGGVEFPIGDIITEADGQPIRTVQDLQRIVLERDEGDTITLTVWRDGEELSIPVTLALVPEN